jgi:hypothetical protein
MLPEISLMGRGKRTRSQKRGGVVVPNEYQPPYNRNKIFEKEIISDEGIRETTEWIVYTNPLRRCNEGRLS